MNGFVSLVRGRLHPPNLLHAAVFKLRGVLMVPVVATLLLCTRWEFERDLCNWLIGLPIYLAAVGLRIWAQMHVRYRLRQPNALVTSGPYAFVRNPIYIANTLLLVALTILCELPWMVPAVVAYAGATYCLAVRFEETRLTKVYGEPYADYRATVPRWLPRIPRPVSLPEPPPVTWLRAAAVEWQCLLLLTVPLVKEALDRLL